MSLSPPVIALRQGCKSHFILAHTIIPAKTPTSILNYIRQSFKINKPDIFNKDDNFYL